MDLLAPLLVSLGSWLFTQVRGELLKDGIYTSGTCGNGLVCPSSSFHQVDCFSTLLSGRCTYSLGNKAFIALMCALTTAGLIIVICFLYFCCCPDWCHRRWHLWRMERKPLRDDIALIEDAST